MGRAARWLALGGVAVAGAAAALHPVTVLELENAARGRTWRFALRGGEVFSVAYHHSMYDQPVTEEFTVDGRGRIALRAVSSPSAAVREYFGITGAGERHAMSRTMPEVVFRVAAGTPQRLLLGGAEHSFLEFGGHGDRLVMRAVRRPALAQLLSAHPGSAP
ncbi:MAG TPA: hypothetical protein VLD85_08960 [Anaeromyxobacteraceae bacterium]|nr:hypothetical protein [Anaeromyxobacteraceae bacterium]